MVTVVIFFSGKMKIFKKHCNFSIRFYKKKIEKAWRLRRFRQFVHQF